jgi:DNA-binding IclR family transcriptional regulator
VPTIKTRPGDIRRFPRPLQWNAGDDLVEFLAGRDRRPEQADPQIGPTLDTVRARGFESIPSVQVRGLYAVSFPILDSRGHAIAALTVPYAERIDKIDRKPIATVEATLSATAGTLSRRMGGGTPRGGD